MENLILVALTSGLICFCWGYHFGKKMMIGVFKSHSKTSSRNLQEIIEYEEAVAEGKIPRG